MTTKKGDPASIVGNLISGLFTAIVDGLLSSVFDIAKERAAEVTKHLARIVLFTLTLFAAIIFALVGTIILLNEYLGISQGWYFVMAAALLLIWALITKVQIEKER